MTLSLRSLAPALLLLGSTTTHAQSFDDEPGEALVPLPSVFDFTRGEAWGVALGVGVEYESAYDGSDEYELELDPFAALQYRRGDHLFFWEGIEAGWRARLADDWLVQVSARYEGGRDAGDSDDGRLNGLDEVDSEIVGAVEVRRGLGEDWRGWLAGRVQAGGSDIGTLGVLAAGYRFGDRTDGLGAELFGFTTFGSTEFLNRDFGVSEAESVSSGLAATDLSGGYRSVGLTAIWRERFGRNFQVAVQAGAELYSDEVRSSPVAREDYEVEVGVTLLWQL